MTQTCYDFACVFKSTENWGRSGSDTNPLYPLLKNSNSESTSICVRGGFLGITQNPNEENPNPFGLGFNFINWFF